MLVQKRSNYLPSETNNPSSNQFLNLASDLGILHVFLQGGGVTLCLLQNALHDGVLEDGHDLWKKVSVCIFRAVF